MTKPATPNSGDGKMLDVVRRLFRDQVVFGMEVPPMALAAARSPGFDPEHHTVDAQILKYVTANYGRAYQRDRDPYRWERFGGDEKLDALYAEEDELRAEFERREREMWAARDERSRTMQQGPGANIEVVAVATKQLSAAIEVWQKSKLALEAAMGRRIDRQSRLQEAYRRQQAAQGK